MKMSYFPGGSPEDLGFSPCGGGGGGGGFMVERCYTSSRAVCPNQRTVRSVKGIGRVLFEADGISTVSQVVRGS
jgi:hypothetical protein